MKITNPQIDIELIKQQTLADTQRCVMCGMCSAHCPTYELSQDENESPRGRIALIQSLLSGRIQSSPSIEKHLDNCLMCRSCETICPSKVPYSDILAFGRHYIESQKTPPAKQGYKQTLGLWLITQNHKIQQLAWLIKLYQRSGLQRLVRKTRILRLLELTPLGLARLERLIPSASRLSKPHPASSRPKNDHEQNISLFTGCLSPIFDQQTLQASKNILESCGYSVNIPKNQTCCGAIHAHNGDQKTAGKCAQRNIDAFTQHPSNKIIYSATGCGASLSAYQKEHPSISKVEVFDNNLADILGFLSRESALKNIKFSALDKKVMIHRPCLSRNILKITDQAETLLSNIPMLDIHLAQSKTICCGAAGSHMISHPEHAQSIREKLLAEIIAVKPDILVSDNLGCVLHIQQGLRSKGLDIEVMHPVVLLERQISLNLD